MHFTPELGTKRVVSASPVLHRVMDTWDEWLLRITGGEHTGEIAKRIGVSRATVLRWSTRQVIDSDTVLKLARAYKVDPVEGLVAGGWMKLEDITIEGLTNVVSRAPTVLLARELLKRAEAAHSTRKSGNVWVPPRAPFDELV